MSRMGSVLWRMINLQSDLTWFTIKLFATIANISSRYLLSQKNSILNKEAVLGPSLPDQIYFLLVSAVTKRLF